MSNAHVMWWMWLSACELGQLYYPEAGVGSRTTINVSEHLQADVDVAATAICRQVCGWNDWKVTDYKRKIVGLIYRKGQVLRELSWDRIRWFVIKISFDGCCTPIKNGAKPYRLMVVHRSFPEIGKRKSRPSPNIGPKLLAAWVHCFQ